MKIKQQSGFQETTLSLATPNCRLPQRWQMPSPADTAGSAAGTQHVTAASSQPSLIFRPKEERTTALCLPSAMAQSGQRWSSAGAVTPDVSVFVTVMAVNIQEGDDSSKSVIWPNRVQSGIPSACFSHRPLIFSTFFCCPLSSFYAFWLPQKISPSVKWVSFQSQDTRLAPVLLQTMSFVTKTKRARNGHEWFIHCCFCSNIITPDMQISASPWHFLYIFPLISSLLLQMNCSLCSPTIGPEFKGIPQSKTATCAHFPTPKRRTRIPETFFFTVACWFSPPKFPLPKGNTRNFPTQLLKEEVKRDDGQTRWG